MLLLENHDIKIKKHSKHATFVYVHCINKSMLLYTHIHTYFALKDCDLFNANPITLLLETSDPKESPYN